MLEEVIKSLRDKGLKKQAVLLEGGSRDIYVLALANPKWRFRVGEIIGKGNYSALEQYSEQIYSKAIPATKNFINSVAMFEPRDYDTPALTIGIENRFKFSDLKKASELVESMYAIEIEALGIIYGEIKNAAYGNEDLPYDIYKDTDFIPEKDIDFDSLLKSYKMRISMMVYRRSKKFLSSIPADIHIPQIPITKDITDSLQELLPDFVYDAGKSPSENYEMMISDAGNVAKDPKRLEQNFRLWLRNSIKNKRERVIKKARDEIDGLLPDKDDDFVFSVLSEDNILGILSDGADIADKYVGLDVYKLLSKSPLEARRNILDLHNTELNGYHSVLIGLQQIIEGGPITNPNASQVSTKQNHHGFPNIRYSKDAVSRLENLARKLRAAFDALPDINDMATSSKLLKKKELSYMMKELPKDPLDVSFGNDSGCCIFVPESKDEMVNGNFVPIYLLEPRIRLFAPYRIGVNPQRMGLVLAFEAVMEDDPKKKILACNSIELSRFGMAGGNSTISRIVEYAEDWLIGYAQRYGYDGIFMGSHSYNTSVNFSKRSRDKLNEKIVFKTGAPFYSDIFVWEKENKQLITRENSCYVLWQK